MAIFESIVERLTREYNRVKGEVKAFDWTHTAPEPASTPSLDAVQSLGIEPTRIQPLARTMDFGPESRARGIHPQTVGAWGEPWGKSAPLVDSGGDLAAFTARVNADLTPRVLPPAETVGTRQALAGLVPDQLLMPTTPSRTSKFDLFSQVAAAPARLMARASANFRTRFTTARRSQRRALTRAKANRLSLPIP